MGVRLLALAYFHQIEIDQQAKPLDQLAPKSFQLADTKDRSVFGRSPATIGFVPPNQAPGYGVGRKIGPRSITRCN